MELIDSAFRESAEHGFPVVARSSPDHIDDERLRGIFRSQLASRHVDLTARRMRERGLGYYTIGSSGHEGNAAVASALRVTDPALLHYRSGAFYAERARLYNDEATAEADRIDATHDMMLGMVAAAADPISGGRHKVFGRAELAIIPQTSTIASHLPRAVGVAMAIRHAVKLGIAGAWPSDAVAVASLGDASMNHSTAVGALNAAAQAAYRGVPLPLLVVCEDNGIGISVPTPDGWIRHAWEGRPGIRYFSADGTDAVEAFRVASEAAAWARERRRPALLHLSTVRFLSHAGADVESAYRSRSSILADLERDPLVRTASHLVARSLATPRSIAEDYERAAAHAERTAAEVARLPKLVSTRQIMAPLSRPRRSVVARAAAREPDEQQRRHAFGGTLPEEEGPMTLAAAINRALTDVLVQQPHALVFGEDVGKKGGVYGVTRGLQKRFGPGRVFDTILDEQTILGLALGAGVSGLLPIPEIQYLAYLHNAEDQLRGEAASQAFFSAGRFTNPMVVRIAGLGYQKGFGGHFHNDNSVSVLRDIPGIVIASPASPSDAAEMIRTCVAAASTSGTVCVIVEPIARYHTRELEPGDEAFLERYTAPARWSESHVAIGEGRVLGSGTDITIATYANGVYLSRRAQARLAAEGISVRIVDLRWLAPLPVRLVAAEAAATGRLLVVDETRESGGVGEGVVAGVVAAGFQGEIRRIAGCDTFIPLGDAAERVLVSEDDIVRAVRSMLQG